MIEYKTVRENNDYIVIERPADLMQIVLVVNDTHTCTVLTNIFTTLANNEFKEIKGLALPKDSNLFLHILAKAQSRNLDEYVSYKEIVNALNIAIFTSNNKMANKISPLFKKQISADIKQVEALTSKTTVEYIKKNNDFEEFLSKVNGTYEQTKYIVYENDEVYVSSLKDSYTKKLAGTYDK